MSSSSSAPDLGQVLKDFSEHGAYPEDETISAARIDDLVISAAVEILQNAKEDLESEIKQISCESAPDVDSWIANAKSIQNDVQGSRKLANSIARKAQEDSQRLETLKEQENYAQFLTKEVTFQDQLLASLRAIQAVHQLLNEAEDLAIRSRIIEAHEKLEIAIKAIIELPVDQNTRALKLLDINASEIRIMLHNQILTIWGSLVSVNVDNNTLTIHKSLPETNTDIQMALKGLEAYQEVRDAARRLWNDIDIIILGPRTDINNGSTPSIQIKDNSLSLNGTTDHTIKSLFSDLQDIIQFIDASLPAEFIPTFAAIMMPPLSRRILETWLETAVPASLDDMVDYQKALALVHEFACRLDILKWPGSERFHDWVSSAPRIWLNKRRETALDWTRNQISLGIGMPVLVERVEKQMVAREEAKELVAATAGSEVTQEWDSAWDSETDNVADPQVPNGERNRLSIEEERQASKIITPEQPPDVSGEDEDDGADAWGWGDDDVDVEPQDPVSVRLPVETSDAAIEQTPRPSLTQIPSTREMTLSEKYWISSMPQPVFNSIKKLYDDGAKLTQPETEHVPISAAAPGLFSLPTLVLAMYRAVSPSYYALQRGGNMYLYNDAMWLAENLGSFLTEWNSRHDLTPRAYGMVKLEPEIKVLTSFGKRAYTSELVEQRTIISDLFGGAQNFFQQDVSPGKNSLNSSIDPVISHVREQAAVWRGILPYSAWASAAGSLVNTIATRIITDVFDLSDISVDEAERIATVISRVEAMDSMFLKNDIPGTNTTGEDQIPMTSRFADKWMKMKFLSEVLQSNLAEVKFLWFESDLSLYFTVDEVVELVGLSFEKNQAVRGAIKEIRERPFPKEEA